MLTYMSSTQGRWIRGVVGIALLVAAVLIGGAGWLLAPLGALMLGTGIADVCPVSPLLGRPARGCDIRAGA